MAQDWIKVEKATARKPEVLRISSALGIHPDHAFGLCVRFWCWCDDQLSDCHAPGVTNVTLDCVIGHAGFATELIKAGWLIETENGLEIPHFDYHLSESAKKRAQSTKRQNVSRSKRDKCHAENVTKARPEKSERREEKSIKPTTSIVQSREVLVPEKMQTPEVQQRAAMWFAHLDVSHPEKRPLPESPQMQAFWEVASRLGPERFCDAVLFSVSSGFANLREQSETKQGHTQQSGPRRNRNGKIIQEMPKEW